MNGDGVMTLSCVCVFRGQRGKQIIDSEEGLETIAYVQYMDAKMEV